MEEASGTLVYTMDLNCNLQSKTIEQVLGMRKEQCVELAGVVKLGVERELGEAPGDRWLRKRADEVKTVAARVQQDCLAAGCGT